MSEGKNSIRDIILLLVIFIAAFFVTGFLDVIAGKLMPAGADLLRTEASLQALVAFILASWVAVRRFSLHPLRYMRLTGSVSWRPFAGIIIIFILALPVQNWIIDFNANFHLPDSMSGLYAKLKAFEDMATEVTDEMLGSPSLSSLVANILVVGVLTGFAEEVFFRGTMQRMFASLPNVGSVAAIWITAFIFSFAHFQFFGFIPRLLLGAFFGYLLYTTGSLWPAVFAHIFNNSLAVLLTWLEVRGFGIQQIETAGIVPDGDIPWLAMISAVLTIGFFVYCGKWFFVRSPK